MMQLAAHFPHKITHVAVHVTTHLAMVILALGVAVGIRCWHLPKADTWAQRWQRARLQLLLPPLILLTTAIAIVLMGPQGQMVCPWEGWSSYGLAIAGLVGAVVWGIGLTRTAWKSLHQVQAYPQQDVLGRRSYLLESSVPFVAQVGFWRSHLVVSQGLLDTLDPEHLEAALVHEQAHQLYHDTFWFFMWGWLRQVTAWLPQTQALWEELLLLRELRADQTAAQHVDGLLLAEALVTVVSHGLPVGHNAFDSAFDSTIVTALTSGTCGDRLTERVEALLSPAESVVTPRRELWTLLLLGCLPLLAIPFHH